MSIKSTLMKLEHALNKASIQFKAFEFSASEKKIWERILIVAEELKSAFYKEWNKSIYKARIGEATKHLNWINEGLMSRNLYIAR